MILRELVRYYQRKTTDIDAAQRLPSFGLEDKQIPFVIELSPDGRVVQLHDTRVPDGKKLRARSFLVPQGVKKTSAIAANLLWDSAEYVLGVDTRHNPERVGEQHAHFRARLAALPASAQDDEGLRAVKAFLHIGDDRPGGTPDLTALECSPVWKEIVETNPVMSFQLAGDTGLVCQRQAIVEAAQPAAAGEETPGFCLVEGQEAPIQRLHTAIKNVWGAQSSGANIVSFNLDAFNSYGKSQGANAPIGKRAEFAYTTALNHLLDKGSRNRVQVGDSSTVFWADGPSRFDSEFTLADFFGEPRKDDPDCNSRAVQALYQSLRSGQVPAEDLHTEFFVLGLAPNAARISIRFWLRAPLKDLAPRILQHFSDLRVVRRYDGDPPAPSLLRLLSSLALQGKLDNVPARLAGEWMRAILEGLPYPSALLNAAVTRCKAEQNVPYLRAAVIKAWLNREYRRSHPHLAHDHAFFKESLDMEQDNPAYRLGRLFAVLERVQEAAQPGINSTIRDRYYGAASTTPVAVFTTLLRLKNAHLKKLNDGPVSYFERLIGEILAPLAGFPRQLSLQDQARFALGYYHQRQAFYARKAEGRDPTATDTEED
ncbi:type I-C CRISPR-associated protein Cas8c/Csd1 [Aquabacterium sp. A7-Y]|uniref:type I-C CRISPR-associated protein Cas8c/Csd1 n=1 Tax=Aquabacterium sp. A7-Y TaxID=1349605 RepID=UPI00223D26A6|nr:type I-C CRISPR-associated protein Cas8c/Csd1 [Aquabacterium sp. A7-Y]MCW7540488.1 type I-C CRISPR-associated protein Cas8c/Csd1 [Aquabacterium sp. A7-Y]